MEATSAAHFSSLPTSVPRIGQIRRIRKKRTREEMFTEIMAVTRSERAHLGEWKDVVAKYRNAASEREDRRDARDEMWRQEDQRWQNGTLELLRDQTDILRSLLEELRGHRVPLQPMFNLPQYSPYSWYKFAFAFQGRQFCVTRTPQGFHYSPAICHLHVNKMWDSMPNKDSIIPYADDILISTKTKEENLEIFDQVLQKIKETEFKAAEIVAVTVALENMPTDETVAIFTDPE
ncbi:uncharacterized protein LOC127043782 [Gopherus flavomarginatus]|uniref:uncharacterized protein LOC127043782 n=1 Tax=Gopherus flavomarginatus TaxID=286002 RepID=UPI0021CC4C4A|nr:uncharacterized protein LOC127043782 [Gopherus flavomarginatus]